MSLDDLLGPKPTDDALAALRAKLPPQLDGASDTTLAVCAAFFGMMKPNSEHSQLHFGMQQGRPSDEAKTALDDLVARGVISYLPDEHGPGFSYRPIVNCYTVFQYVLSARFGKGVKLTVPL